MAVFRINKTQDYTVMSNFHLKDRSLSLKSKGLLSLILSLSEDWNYTTRGLAAICKEGVDSIGTALKELDGAGYIKRNRLRDEKGKIIGLITSLLLGYPVVTCLPAVHKRDDLRLFACFLISPRLNSVFFLSEFLIKKYKTYWNFDKILI